MSQSTRLPAPEPGVGVFEPYVAIDPCDVDRIVFAAGDRLYLSETGGLFWRRLELELPGVTALAFVAPADER